MLLVPTTSVGYDAEKEERAEQEAKMAKISAIEEAKERLKTNLNFDQFTFVNRDRLLEQGGKEAGDTFIQKLMAGVFRHLEVTVTDVHIRCLKSSQSLVFNGFCQIRGHTDESWRSLWSRGDHGQASDPDKQGAQG